MWYNHIFIAGLDYSTAMKTIRPFLILVTLPYLYASDIHIVVDWKAEIDNSSCSTRHPCASLDFALSKLSNCHGHPANVTIHSGNYTFTLKSMVTKALFQNCSAVSIIGISDDNVTVNCGEDAGLFFRGIQSTVQLQKQQFYSVQPSILFIVKM